jgi:tripartite-type tricarboxylate transporter receptor subunit TctC
MMKTASRLGLALCLLAGAFTAAAQSSQGIVRLVVPFNPGGGSDLFARVIAPGLSEALKQTVIVENRAGAGGVIGADYVAKSKPDGRTFLISDSAAWSVSPSLYPSLPYSAKDLIPVVDVARFANVLIVPANSRFNSLDDVLKAARKDPGKLTIASAGNGSSPHLTAEKLQAEAKIKLTHVPYKGSGPALADTIAGQVDMVFSGLPSISEYLKGGKVKALAIASPTRSPFAPDVPTMSEAGVPGFESMISQGLFAPAGTPDDVVAKINAAVNQIMGSKEMAARAQQLKVEPHAYTSAEYKAWLTDQSVIWAKLIKDAGVKVD